MHLITSHLNTDFDSLASMIAAQKLYPEAVVCPPGAMSRRVKDFVNHYGHLWKIQKPSKIPIDQVTLMIVVDTRARSRIGPFAALVGKQDVEVHIYDHHPPTVDDIPAHTLVYEHIGATTTLMVERLLKARAPITREEATLFALAIYDDTGALTYEATTPRDVMAIARLRQMDADLSMILARVEVSMPAQERKLLDAMVENSSETYVNGAKVVFSWAESEQYVEGLSIFVHKLKDYCESHVTIAAVRCGKKTCLIARSAPNVLNVKDFLVPYGGSGHLQAGSATLPDRDPKELLKELGAKLPEVIAPLVLVEDIMTSPVMAIAPCTEVGDAYRTMIRFGLQALPVVSEGELLGMMTRKDLDKAHLHGFDRTKVRDFMTEGVISIPSNASVNEAHRLMATYSFERIPVLKDGRLAGIVTRADLVRALFQSYRGGRAEKDDDGSSLWTEDVAPLLDASFTPDTLATLRRIGERAQALGMRAYIVGGAVRDILRGDSNVDLDVSVEGDAETFVRSWDELGCRGTVHGRYKTGTIVFPSGLKVDIATARREFYEYAAAMPQVSSDSLKQDLARRDFSINAIAVSLSAVDWGLLVDFYGGRRDLKEGYLRALHNLSFVEDPSRVLRGVRLEQRLGLRFEDNTLRLIRSAIKGGLLGKLSSPRVRIEVEINGKDRCPAEIFARMQELEIWESLFPGLHFGPLALQKMTFLQRLLHWMDRRKVIFKGLEWLTYIAAIFSDAPTHARSAAMDRLNLSSHERNTLSACLSSLPLVEQFLASKRTFKNSEVYLFLKKHSFVPLLYCMASLKRAQARRWIALHFFSFTPMKGVLTGNDLKKMGYTTGPWLGDMLEGIRLERMDGRILTREDEVLYLQEMLRRD